MKIEEYCISADVPAARKLAFTDVNGKNHFNLTLFLKLFQNNL
jgi:hypothetical protein